jgi:hypothetical protein
LEEEWAGKRRQIKRIEEEEMVMVEDCGCLDGNCSIKPYL